LLGIFSYEAPGSNAWDALRRTRTPERAPHQQMWERGGAQTKLFGKSFSRGRSLPRSQRYNGSMSRKTYFLLVGTFFFADVIFHAIRLFVWWNTGEDMQFPMWVSYGAIVWSGFFAWQGFKLGSKS